MLYLISDRYGDVSDIDAVKYKSNLFKVKQSHLPAFFILWLVGRGLFDEIELTLIPASISNNMSSEYLLMLGSKSSQVSKRATVQQQNFSGGAVYQCEIFPWQIFFFPTSSQIAIPNSIGIPMSWTPNVDFQTVGNKDIPTCHDADIYTYETVCINGKWR